MKTFKKVTEVAGWFRKDGLREALEDLTLRDLIPAELLLSTDQKAHGSGATRAVIDSSLECHFKVTVEAVTDDCFCGEDQGVKQHYGCILDEPLKDPWEGHTKSDQPCAKCGGVVYMREINDYPDTAITCSECHAYYVVDGPDS